MDLSQGRGLDDGDFWQACGPETRLGLPQAARLLASATAAKAREGGHGGPGGLQKGGLRKEVLKVRSAHPDAEVEVWAQDEARIGLKPILRRAWALRGDRPLAVHNPRYKWVYVFGFVRPDTGRVFSLLMPTVSTAVMSICLEHFANEVGASATRRIVLVLDGAGWHTAKDLVVPEGIDLVFQPPYSPELQPSEQLWPLLHEPLANRNFVDLDELEDVLCEACCGLEDDPEYLRSQTLFHWWSDAIR